MDDPVSELYKLHAQIRSDLAVHDHRHRRHMAICIVLATLNLALASFAVIRLHEDITNWIAWMCVGFNAYGCYAITVSMLELHHFWRQVRAGMRTTLFMIEQRLRGRA